MKYAFLWAICLLPSFAFAQTYDMLHVNILENNSSVSLSATGSVKKALNGSDFLITGTIGEGDFARAVVTRTDSNFNPIWSRRFNFSLTGGAGWQSTYGADLIELGNDQYVLAAGVNNFLLSNAVELQNLDMAIIKFTLSNTGGAIEWAKCFGGEYADVPHRLIRTQDGGFLASGYSNPEQALNTPSKIMTYLAKVDANGNPVFNRRYRNQASECNTTLFALTPDWVYRPVVETADGGLVFTQACDEYVYIYKTDASGNALWARQFVAGGGIGDAFEAENIATLGVAAGTGGTLVNVRELSDGRLAFLGNQYSFIAGLLVNAQNFGIEAAGVSIPMSYVFTTNAQGQFEHGSLFFRETNDPGQPTEAQSLDMTELENGDFIIACVMKQWADQGGAIYAYPSIVRYDPDQDQVDQHVKKAHVLSIFDNGVYVANGHLPAGMSRIKFWSDEPQNLTQHREGAFAYNGARVMKVKNIAEIDDNSECFESIEEQMHSAPIELTLTNTDMTATDLTATDMTGLQVSARFTLRSIACSSTVSATEPLWVLHPIQLTPALHDGLTTLHLQDEYWINGRFELCDMRGILLQAGDIDAYETHFDLSELPSGVYLIRVVRPDGVSTVVRTIKR